MGHVDNDSLSVGMCDEDGVDLGCHGERERDRDTQQAFAYSEQIDI